MKKKLVSLILVAMMIATSLTGCASVTAESLIDNTFKDITYAEYEMNISLKMEMEQYDMSMDVELDMNADVESSDSVAYTKLKMDMSAMGMSESQETETYVVVDDDTLITYTYDEYYEEWTYTEDDADKDDNMLPVFESDMFEELEMEKTDDGYEVTGLLVDTDELFAGTSNEVTEELKDALEDVDIVATFNFNKDQELEELSFVFEVDEDETYDIEGTEVTISEMEITYEFKSFDGEIEVPRDVEEDAVSEDDYYDDYYDDYEDEDEYSDEELSPLYGISGSAPIGDNVTFTIKGSQYALGAFTLDDMKSLGYEIDDYSYTEGDEYYINAGDYEYISLYDDNVCSMYLYFKNNTSGALDILECDIAGIDFDQSYEMEYEGGTHCDFSIAGVPAGTSYLDVEQILGSPDSHSSYDDGTIYYYYYLDNDVTLCLDFHVEYGLTGFDVYASLY